MRFAAEKIYTHAIAASLPEAAVKKHLSNLTFSPGDMIVISVGKAGWTMASAAVEVLGDRIKRGLVLTKYHHSCGSLPGFEIIEAGHPILDENSFRGTRKALELTENLRPEDTVLFLLSGGGSALFELSELEIGELQEINQQLLRSGANIQEINTVRKRLSLVKGGRFAKACAPAKVVGLLLSDVLGNRPDMIASGPACVDGTTCAQAIQIVEKYRICLSEKAKALLQRETPKELPNATCCICGDVHQLCKAAAEKCEQLGYTPILLTADLCCEAREAGSFLASIARSHAGTQENLAFIAGGETVVHLTGCCGKGGRNQELALAAAEGIAGLENAAVFSVGSDGTDGPTDAAGGYVDGQTWEKLAACGISPGDALANHDAYHALEKSGGLIITGATGTNVNDIAVVLICKKTEERKDKADDHQ